MKFVSPVATHYDANGQARGRDFSYINSTHLDPDQSSAFEMLSTGRDFSDIIKYRLQVDGNYDCEEMSFLNIYRLAE